MPDVFALLPDHKVTFHDNNGNPASGGKLFVYDAGTSTKADIFTESDGLTAQANPVILDSRGEPPNGVYAPSGSYKLVFAPSTDTDPPTSPFWTRDNVDPINDQAASIDEWTASGAIPLFQSTTTFTLDGDQTTDFHIGRRIRLLDSGGFKYGYISNSVFSSPTTTVTVVLDSGALDSGLSAASLGLLRAVNSSIPHAKVNSTGITLTGTLTAGTVTLTTLTAGTASITGNATVTGTATIGTMNATTAAVTGTATIGTAAITAATVSGTATITTAVITTGTTTTSNVTTLNATNANVSGVLKQTVGTVASAAALPVDVAGNIFSVTGTTTITSINSKGAGTVIWLNFAGALTLTHNATTLILPDGQNITTAAGDVATLYEYSTGNWKLTNYQKFQKSTGGLVQSVSTQTGAVATGTTVVPNDDTIPQITEGDEYMTRAITPKNANNTLVINVVVNFAINGANVGIAALFQDSTANALAAAAKVVQVSGDQNQIVFRHTMTAGTISSTTFRVRAGPATAGTFTFNGTGGARRFGGVLASSISIREVAP